MLSGKGFPCGNIEKGSILHRLYCDVVYVCFNFNIKETLLQKCTIWA